jgi:hypothetical protein
MSLSELSYYVRKFGPISIVGFIVFIIFFGIFRIVFSNISNPAPAQKAYEPPFGLLDPIHFTHHIDYPENVTFTIDNIEGRPIDIASEAEVFFVPPSRTRFGYQQSIAFMAKAVGIDTEAQTYTLDGTTATYKDELRSLIIDITNYNYLFEMDYKKIPTVFSDTYTPSDLVIKEEAKAFLRKMNKFTPSLAQGSQNIIYRRYDPGVDDFVVVENPEEANVVEVDFFVPDVGSFPVVSPKYFNSHTYVTLVFRQDGNVVIKSQVRSFQNDVTSPGKYPLKSGAQAWEELKNKQGVIVSPAKGSTDIVVREMFIGYYSPEVYQPYLMPVYVFLGDNGFAAYVSAVDNAYINPKPPEVISPTVIAPTAVPTTLPEPTLLPTIQPDTPPIP